MKPVRGSWLFILLVAAAVASVALMFSGTLNSSTVTVPPDKARSADFGKAQAELHKAGVVKPPIVPFIRTLSFSKKSNKACPCPAVFQLQRALKKAHARPAKAKSTGVFGRATRQQLGVFQKRQKIPVSGIYGRPTHLKLSKFYDLTGRRRLQQVAKDRKDAAINVAARVIKAHVLLVAGNTLAYSQSATRSILPHYPRLPPATDCSGFVTWFYMVLGLPDPNGFGFSPVGYTGTLAQHGVRVTNWAKLKMLDLVFYGGGYPYGHVAIVLDPIRRLVLTHGHRGVQFKIYNYRTVSRIQRYR